MTTIIVLFNLKDGADPTTYERWAQTTDLPRVNALPSVRDFRVLKSNGLLGGGSSPYAYVEVLEVDSVAGLRADTGGESMKKVAREFREFAAAPLFIVTEPLA